MQLFKFIPITSPTTLEQGRMINNVKSVMWTERYSEPGEFEIVSQLSGGLKEFLPIGSLISHSDTLEVMIVENHEINEEEDNDPVITITGRTFDTYLENRIVGINQVRSSSYIQEYALTADYTWNQAVKLINDHIVNTQNANDALVNVVAQTSVTGTGTSVARSIERGDLSQKLRELLAIDDLGIKTIRRNTFGVSGSSTQTILSIFQGVDKSSSIIFSWKAGDLDSADYLFSNKKLKTSALVQGRYVNVMVDFAPTKYDRRIMMVDADDIDEIYPSSPAGGDLTTVINKMTIRGQQVLMSQKNVAISRTDISKVCKYQYRKDYNVGDLISLDGNFGQIVVMRVTEFVEIEDEDGESGHPTLSVLGV